MKDRHDVVVVGGGPAGLSAALALGRARRKVLLVDGGTPRNARALEIHTFVTRDGTPPAEFRRIARAQLAPYTTVTVQDGLVTRAAPEGADFLVSIDAGNGRTEDVRARILLLAAGVVNEPPPIAGMAEHWGRSVFACPYCHGFEHRDQAWGALAMTDAVAEWSLLLRGWTERLVVFTHGAELSPPVLAKLAAAKIAVEPEPIAALVAGPGEGERLASVELRSERKVPCEALFVRPAQRPTPLVEQLGLVREEMGHVRVDMFKESSVRGVFVAGDAATMMQSAIVAAAEGTVAGATITHRLVMEDVGAGATLHG